MTLTLDELRKIRLLVSIDLTRKHEENIRYPKESIDQLDDLYHKLTTEIDNRTRS